MGPGFKSPSRLKKPGHTSGVVFIWYTIGMSIELHKAVSEPGGISDQRGEMQEYFRHLREWVAHLNQGGLIHDVGEIFGWTRNRGSLQASSYCGIGFVTSTIYADCNFSLVLSGEDGEGNNLGSIYAGFNVVPKFNGYFQHMPRDYVTRRAGIDPGDVIISQLQAGEQAGQILTSKWRWEQALVTLVAGWAAQTGLGRIHIWPGELVRQDFDLTDEEIERFHTRYNGTAKGLGFKRNLDEIYTQPF